MAKKTYDKLTKVDKAAVLLISLGEDLAAELIQHFPRADAARILNAAGALGAIDQETVQAVQKEFQTLLTEQQKTLFYNREATTRILTTAYATLGETHTPPLLYEPPQAFRDAEELPPKTLQQILDKEQPQTLALILAHLSPQKAGAVIAHFPAAQRSEILLRMSALQEVDHRILDEVGEALAAQIATLHKQATTQVGGIQKTAAVLAGLPAAQRNAMLAELELRDPATAATIRSQLWTFEDIAKLRNADIEKLLVKLDPKDLALALRQCSDTLKARFYQAMSKRRAEQMREDIAVAKPTPIKTVEDAQRRIATTAQQMITSGELNDPSEKVV